MESKFKYDNIYRYNKDNMLRVVSNGHDNCTEREVDIERLKFTLSRASDGLLLSDSEEPHPRRGGEKTTG